MKDIKNMTAAELAALSERVEHQRRERRLEERVESELPGRARFPRLDGETGWLEPQKKSCGNKGCRKGCASGEPSHGPYWYLYTPAPGTKFGVKPRHLGRELPADLADAFGLPEKLDAADAHRYSRQVREAKILQDEADAMASEREAEANGGATGSNASSAEREVETEAAT